MTAVATLVMKADATGLVQGETALKGLTAQAGNAEKAAGRLGGQAKQLGWQISQIAQQGAVTGNWAQAFAIQLSDIAMIMGAGGVLGIALGTAASVALPLLGVAFGDSADEAARLETALDDLDAAAGRAQKSADALAASYSGADAQMQSFLGTVANAERLAAVQAMSEAVDAMTDSMGPLFATNKGAPQGFLTGLGSDLGLSLAAAKELQGALDQLATADGFQAQTAAAQALYAELLSIYGAFDKNQALFDAMPPEIQAIAKALADAGISTEKLAGSSQTVAQSLQGIGAWALQAENDVPGVFLTTSKAAQDAGASIVAAFTLGKTALDTLIDAQPGADFLGTAIGRAQTLAARIWNAAAAMASVSDVAPLNGPAGMGGTYGTAAATHADKLAADLAKQQEILAGLGQTVVDLGNAAGGAAPQIDDAGMSLREGAERYHQSVQENADKQVAAINDLGGAVNALTSGDIPGAISGLAQLGQSISGLSGMGGFGSMLGSVSPWLGIAGAIGGLFGSLFGGGSSGPNQNGADRLSLQQQLYTLQGDTDALRAQELSTLSANNKKIQEHIWRLQDEADAAAEAARIEDERNGLLQQLYALEGDTEALRALQIQSLDESNRALQENIWALQDQAAVADERMGLQMQLWNLEGDTAAIREQQLAQLDESNRALQEQIWALEDAAQAAQQLADALKPDTFKTLFDYQSAQAQALYGWGMYGTTYTPPTPGTSAAPTAASEAEAAAQAADLLAEIVAMHSELAGLSKAMRDTMTKWDTVGLGTYTVDEP